MVDGLDLRPCFRTKLGIKDTLHHGKVDVAMSVYDKASTEDIPAGLRIASKRLLGSDLLPTDLLPTTP
jgi:hypothetical protein